ncbi:lysosome-associated membrane glycoprotein 2 isoform X1 [Rhineura floridana]|uniref:lysosome-associated membrane glycoprotein 2 isoform X1 n=1 Tax=Rhineura floridana TaxID=261503 RepID=UPI002AC8550C|nr:lysosome-associated membrane glycoprotein 2 isoform X1 [Rhineura floridana]
MEIRCSVAGRLLGPLCCGLFLFVLLLLEGSAVFQAYAVDVEVRDDSNVTCLYAKWMMNLSIIYESELNEYKSTALMLPDSVSYDGSSCGNEASGPVLAIEFGEGHLWSISFTKTENTYQGSISFTYNTNDTVLFPDAKRKGQITTFANYPSRPIELDTVFICHNVDSVEADNVTQDLWNVTLQAFLNEGSLSNMMTQCDKDMAPSVPAAPVTAAITTDADSTNSTTESNAIRTFPPLPTPEPGEKPATGIYSVKNGTTDCLLASMGLQLNITGKYSLLMNIDPNTTTASGHCGSTTAVLNLKDTNCEIDFLFAVRNTSSERFYLKEMNITVFDSTNGTQFSGNDNLSYWDTSLGNSYMCRKEETLVVAPSYKVNVFDLKIQPFAVKEGQYSTAQECLLDDDTILIPVVVGAALAGLIVIIVIAYVIGRRKSHAGYQTL